VIFRVAREKERVEAIEVGELAVAARAASGVANVSR
jgi:hypothetical protein